MKKLLILLFSILISFNSWGETKYYYYENGQIKSEEIYKDGKKDGKVTYWDENGQIETEEIYKNDKKVSRTIYKYHDNGQIKLELNWKDSKIVKSTNWYKNGQIELEMNYKDGVCISGDCDYFK